MIDKVRLCDTVKRTRRSGSGGSCGSGPIGVPKATASRSQSSVLEQQPFARGPSQGPLASTLPIALCNHSRSVCVRGPSPASRPPPRSRAAAAARPPPCRPARAATEGGRGRARGQRERAVVSRRRMWRTAALAAWPALLEVTLTLSKPMSIADDLSLSPRPSSLHPQWSVCLLLSLSVTSSLCYTVVKLVLIALVFDASVLVMLLLMATVLVIGKVDAGGVRVSGKGGVGPVGKGGVGVGCNG
eukprot:2474445-Pleurochrysis_carterae.AAC.1